ncbi:glycosyltransferase family 4 protein [Ensifer sp. ENS04]|uniref:glycosyltransferase family 4 protein n=1 Tax=Ensifer sp. ENS04 TaxID=2769281 RepID=UPI001782A58F|nr:glycosyltransferase family 4 protein [Ensifer sp. ENS04]MBD9541580.1 glycosyltransferase family 4 protein [Ensifer sp. ENS04]
MRLLMFCENANQVHLCHDLVSSEFFPSHVEPEVLILDWDKETVAWVVGAVNSTGWEVSVTNVFDASSPLLRKAVTSAQNPKDRKSALVDLAFDYLKQYFGRADVLLIQFNDASVRGGSMAIVCRNTGLRRLLVQDGFLNFASKTSNLAGTDQNYAWGATQPELVAVWGQAMKDALVQRHNSNPSSVKIAGPAKREIAVPRTVDHDPVGDRKIRVLWADQAILDQKKAPEAAWLQEFADIARQLSQFDTSLRLHPSTKERSRAALEQSVGETFSVLMTGSPKISEGEIQEYDVVVTYYSTVFLDCLANNIPCVVLKTRSIDIELPYIDHPLLVYCKTAEELPAAVGSAAQVSASGETPPDIFSYVAEEDGITSIVRLLAEALPPTKEEKAAIIKPIVRDIEVYSNIRRLLGKRLLVIGGSFGNHIGVGKPIKVFVEYLRGLDLEIEFHLATNGDRENLLRKVASSSLVLINSFDVVRALKEADLQDVVALCKMRSVPIVFYCHETQFVFRRLLEDIGGKVDGFVNNVLPSAHALAVSDRQADWLGSLGAKSVRTVYNSIGPKFVPIERKASLGDKPLILMVGTQQRRKGVELFSHVADLAKDRGLDWRFVWLGAYTKGAEGCYKSCAVEWMGYVSAEEVRHWLAKTAVFFLSSIDDPLPLGVGEALMSGIPSVVYAETGFSDFITLHNAGEVFNIYEPHVALDKLKAVLTRAESYAIDANLVRDIVGVDSFGKRMLVALGEIVAGASPDYVYSKTVSGPVALHRILKAKNGNGKGPAKAAPKGRKSGFKWTVLYALEEKLPAFIVKPGEKVLKKLRVI